MKLPLLGLLLGFGLGWWISSGPESVEAAAAGSSDRPTLLSGRGSSSTKALLALEEENATKTNRLQAAASCGLPTTLPELIDVLENLEHVGDREMASIMKRRLIHHWIEKDPEAAFDAIASDLAPQLRRSCVFLFSVAWGKKDPEAALRRIDSIEDADQRRRLAGYVIRNLSDDRLLFAFEAIEKFEWNYHTGWPLATAFERLAGKDPQQAMELAFRFSDERSRSTAVSQALRVWGKKDPRAAMRFLHEQKEEGKGPMDGWREFFRGWAESDPIAA
ncbi:MAG: hypothetical protein AAF514_13220, partial [Verrucomicrobiota bacterium]